MAVDTYVDASGTGVSLAERWNGTVWTLLPTPNPPGAAKSVLNGVSCISSSSCVAVGAYLDGSGTNHVFAEGWNGTTWTLQSVPEPAGAQNAQLNAVSCSSTSNCTAVGDYTNSSSVDVTLAEQWDGTVWTVQPTPSPSGAQFSVLAGIACLSSNACIAVGLSDQGSLAERWDGTSWSILSTPTAQSAGAALFSVSCTSSSACLAVGSTAPNTGMTLAEQWNGTKWKVQSTPNPTGSQDAVLNSVACSSSSACTAVGWSVDSSHTFSTVAERWDGHDWSLQSTQNELGGSLSQLGGVACPGASTCVAVGIAFDASGAIVTLGEGWDGTQWSAQPTVNPQGARGAQLLAVSCKSSSACMAVGQAADPFGNAKGIVAELWDGAAWRITPAPSPAGAPFSALSGVSCTSPSACIAVGVAFDSSDNPVGTLTEVWNGTSWSIQPTPTSASPGAFLNAVSCTSPNACTATGQNSAGQVMAERWNGTSWSIQPVPVPAGAPMSALPGVSCTSATACTAVGAIFDSSFNAFGTVAEQWNGKTWRIQPSPTTASTGYGLNAVSCTSASACTAVGNTDSGLLAERWDGTAWTVQSAVTPSGTEGNGDFFSGVSCSSPSACTATGLVFGAGGFPPFTVAERWDGTQWTVQSTPNLPGAFDIDPPAVSCPTLSTCMAVGGFTNDGPKVTLAEQWNGQAGSTAVTASSLEGGAASPSPCTRPLAFGAPQTLSTSLRFRPAIQTARARFRELRALQWCRGT